MLSEITLILSCYKKWESKYWKDDRKTIGINRKKDCLANKHKLFKPENELIFMIDLPSEQ